MITIGDRVTVLAAEWAKINPSEENYQWMIHAFIVQSLFNGKAKIESESGKVVKIIPVECLAVLPKESAKRPPSVTRCIPLPYRVGDLVQGLGCKYRVKVVHLDKAQGKHEYELEPYNDRVFVSLHGAMICNDYHWQCDRWSHNVLEKIKN